jgi:catechol 2,3-dioxygenase-like lactoylglutathione lyase family enzyme
VINLLVNLDIDDLDKAVRFYSSVFGLKVGRRLGAVGLEMLGCSFPIYLLERSATAPAGTTSRARPISGIGRRCISTLSSMKSNRRLREPS